MLINSITFWIFFALFLIPYFALSRYKVSWQNVWLLIGSYFFYGWADWKMIPILLTSTIVFYLLGLGIGRFNNKSPQKASLLSVIGVLFGIGLLVYFKYLGFLIDEFAKLFESIGLKTNITSFQIIMPIGISFFTFKLISYVIEVHRENIKAEKDFITFASFVAFFPTIMSGPIDRPNKFLPQLGSKRLFLYDNISEGGKRILWGMFLKMCIANQLAPYTDAVFNNVSHHSTISFIVAGILYFLQMYADFCGYSHMAIGTAQVMGLKVAENFNRPFFAQNVAEYWRRWHMSLTSWITDYIFMPLNIKFRNWGNWGLYLATIINLIVIGIWHGANWTYFFFGLYHGLLLVIVTANEKKRKKIEKKYGLKKKEWYKWSRRILTFFLCMIGCILFRANSTDDISYIFSSISNGFGQLYTGGSLTVFTCGIVSAFIMLFKDYKDEYKRNIYFFHAKREYIRLISIAFCIIYILLFGELSGNSFIYFQF